MIGDNYFTADERTLLALYLEDTKAQTEENIFQMQKELTSAEKELFLLAEDVLEKLSSMTEDMDFWDRRHPSSRVHHRFELPF